MKKKIAIILGILLIVFGIIDLVGANYLVTYAIARKDGVHSEVAPDSITADEAQQIIDQNVKLLYEEVDTWKDTVTTTTMHITSDDGLLLEADYYDSPEATGHKYAIVVHGYSSNRGSMLPYGMTYSNAGYQVLMPDLRAHGNSEGDYIGMGWLDKADIVKWIDTIIEMDPEAQIILHGVSMGGATVLMTSGEDLPDNVKAIVDDCGYTSVWDIFSDEVVYLFHVPTFPVLNTASVVAQIRAGYSFTEASAIEQVKKTSLPIFFSHGSEDNFVHTDMVYELYDACPTHKELYVVEGAGHGQAMYLDPETYFSRIFTFLSAYVK